MSTNNLINQKTTGCSLVCVHCANECDERLVDYDLNTTAQDLENDEKLAIENAKREDENFAEQTRLAQAESDRHKIELISGLKRCEEIATAEQRFNDAAAWKTIRDQLEKDGVMYGDNIANMEAELTRIAGKHLFEHKPGCMCGSCQIISEGTA